MFLFAPIAELPMAPVDASLLFAVLFDAAMFVVAVDVEEAVVHQGLISRASRSR